MLSFISTGANKVIPRNASSVRTAAQPRRPSTILYSTFAGIAIFTVYNSNSYLTSRFASSSSSTASSPKSPTTMSITDLSGMKDIDGNVLDPSIFDGKVVFAMNVASACGYTKPGYDLLNRLTTKFSKDDLVAVAIPCNSFGWQENGSEESIKLFALSKAERLVVTERSVVNGGKPHPIVGLAKTKFPGRIGWNFDGRFVFDRNGLPAARFGNSAQPDEIEAAIEKLI